MGRAPCCDKATVKRGPWSPEEDATLKAYMEEHGTGGNWIALPHKIGLKRCGKSCRLRWLNYLRPNIKHGGFSEAEDELICRLYISIGSRWSIIAAQLPGRTDNDIKNYWNTRLKKKLLGKRSGQSSRRPSTNPDTITQANMPATCQNPTPSETLSRSALERMQLHMQLQGLHNPFSSYCNLNPNLLPNPNFSQNKFNFQRQGLERHEVLLNSSSTTTTSMEESLDSSTNNLVRFPSPVIGVGADNLGSGFSSPGTGSELYELLYGNNGSCNIGSSQNENLMADLSGMKEWNVEAENVSWWSSNGFDEKLSFAWGDGSSFQPEMMLQEYYGLLGHEIM